MSQTLKHVTAAFLTAIAAAMFFAFLPFPAAAQGPAFPDVPACEGYNPEDPFGVECGRASGLTTEDPRIVIGRIINVALALLGIVATVLIVYAGFKWMTAGGNEENVKSAQKILMAAVIGLAIILSAYGISNFVLRSLYQATQNVQYPQ